MNLERLLSLMTDAAPLLQGLFGGIGVMVLWEILLKPRRIRRGVARILMVEVAQNRHMAALAAIYFDEHDNASVPEDTRMSVYGFAAVADRIGLLPSKLVAHLVLLNSQLHNLNGIRENYALALERYHNAKDRPRTPGPPMGPTIVDPVIREESSLNSMLKVYRSGLDGIIDSCNNVLPQLQRYSEPFFWITRWFRKPTIFTREELARQTGAFLAEQEARYGRKRPIK